MKIQKFFINSLFIFFMGISLSAFGAEQEIYEEAPKYEFARRALLIFLDDSETNYGALSYSLLSAISQKASPIIVSRSLLFNVTSEYGNLPSDTPKHLHEKFEKAHEKLLKPNATQAEKDEAMKEQKAIYLKASGFKQEDWVIKYINSDLYLLITKDYLNSLNIADEALLYGSTKITNLELKLGLKINHRKTVAIDSIKPPDEHFSDGNYFNSALYSIFCRRSEYKNKNFPIPSWAIHMNGHGKFQKSIAWLKTNDFKAVLTFFENRINVHLFTYNSCYAAGKNIETLYKSSESAIQKTYSFPIIAEAMTDAVTFVTQANPVFDSNGNLAVKSYVKYNDFLVEATKSDTLDYAKIAKILQKTDREFIQNLPQIKLPGLEWFSVLNSEANIASIGSVLAKSRDSKMPLDIDNFFRKDPKALLLYAQDIPFELSIDGRRLQAIVSMIPGIARHTIKGISSSSRKPEEILDLFMQIKDLGVEKIFYIEKIGGGGETIKDVVVYNKAGSTYAFFRRDVEKFIKKPGSNPELIAEQEKKQEYSALLTPEIKSKMNYLSVSAYEENKEIKSHITERAKRAEIKTASILDSDAMERISKAKFAKRIKALKIMAESDNLYDREKALQVFYAFILRNRGIDEAIDVAKKIIFDSGEKPQIKNKALRIFQALINKGLKFDEASDFATLGMHSSDTEIWALKIFQALVEKNSKFLEASNAAARAIENGEFDAGLKLLDALKVKAPDITKERVEELLLSPDLDEGIKEELTKIKVYIDHKGH